jgi:hypothetical protein
MNNVLNELTDEVTFAQVHLERSEAALGAVIEEYFEDLTNDPKTPKGKEGIISGFEQNGVFAGIARDYVVETRSILGEMAATIAVERGTAKGQTGEETALMRVFSELDTLERARVLAYADEFANRKKGEAVIRDTAAE